MKVLLRRPDRQDGSSYGKVTRRLFVKQLDPSNLFQRGLIKGNFAGVIRLAVAEDGEQQCWFFFDAILFELLGRPCSLVVLSSPRFAGFTDLLSLQFASFTDLPSLRFARSTHLALFRFASVVDLSTFRFAPFTDLASIRVASFASLSSLHVSERVLPLSSHRLSI
jgi:hypothetical protein